MEFRETNAVENLALQIKNSNEKAFNTLFELLWRPMLTYASSLLMDDTLAKDMVQDVWMDFWQRRKEIEIQNTKAYLYKAIRYRCYNHLRDSKLNKIQLEVANSICITSEVEQNDDVVELYTRINNVIASLPQRCQEIFKLSRINNINNREIANQLNISQRSVENQISFALRKLRKDIATVKVLFSFF
ncbi:RNA polymerase sigma-70 factor (ECF subfamily) [Saonia flava]|uniref:RNA polymerase sigma-70 factor (ECF subfamily) n=1 Tax=Saonia flava TaxID=523696 RepID=A0A846QZI8_9FLAO|nr:RNA polymerase sigma-70 factor [Saonia flava]NJB71075.1 RNA polymerase sigma-70 factor (ECF subfamily) [Saonia flava]